MTLSAVAPASTSLTLGSLTDAMVIPSSTGSISLLAVAEVVVASPLSSSVVDEVGEDESEDDCAALLSCCIISVVGNTFLSSP